MQADWTLEGITLFIEREDQRIPNWNREPTLVIRQIAGTGRHEVNRIGWGLWRIGTGSTSVSFFCVASDVPALEALRGEGNLTLDDGDESWSDVVVEKLEVWPLDERTSHPDGWDYEGTMTLMRTGG